MTYKVICDGELRGEYATLQDAQLAAYIGGKNFRGIAPRIINAANGREVPVPLQMFVDAGADGGARFMVTR